MLDYIIATTDVQNSTICRSQSTYSIQCSYLRGSKARGCVYFIASMTVGMKDINGTIGRNDSAVSQEFDSSHFDDIVYFYDWEENGSYGRLPLTFAISDALRCTGKLFVI